MTIEHAKATATHSVETRESPQLQLSQLSPLSTLITIVIYSLCIISICNNREAPPLPRLRGARNVGK